MNNTMSLEEWKEELIRLGRETFGIDVVAEFGEECWREMYDDYDGDITPEDALREGMRDD